MIVARTSRAIRRFVSAPDGPRAARSFVETNFTLVRRAIIATAFVGCGAIVSLNESRHDAKIATLEERINGLADMFAADMGGLEKFDTTAIAGVEGEAQAVQNSFNVSIVGGEESRHCQ